jgi:hypothetical protein
VSKGGSQDNDFPFTVAKMSRRCFDMLADFPRLLYMHESVKAVSIMGASGPILPHNSSYTIGGTTTLVFPKCCRVRLPIADLSAMADSNNLNHES